MLNEDQEIWKPYPDYPFIEASNLGRVRTKDRYVTVKGQGKRLIQGRILKQKLRSDGYLQVHVRVNGKSIFLFVHRIVAACFLPNLNNYPEVNHKDNNPKNNVVSNLEWCDRQYNIAYREKYGMSAAKVFGKPVFAVNLKTGKVLRFESQHEAARQLGVDQSSITKVIKGKKLQVAGYWFTEDKNEITKEKIHEIKANMHYFCGVIAINIETSDVFWFKSQSEAARQLGFSQGIIGDVLKGRSKKAKGYWFCYADKNAIEKVRAEFGDEIAEKVEKLMCENNNQLNKK